MKKGFTLIELLAVIIILAIVALIATPIVLDVVENSRKSASKSSAALILSGVRNYYTEQYLDDDFSGYTCTITNKTGCDEIVLSGDRPDSATIHVDSKGNVNGEIVIGNYTYYYCDNSVSETKCPVCKLKEGTPLTVGSKYECNPGDGIKRNFYVLSNNGDDYNLIMERNIDEGHETSISYYDAIDYFTTGEGSNYSSSWTNVKAIRLPEVSEIANAIGYTAWTNDASKYFLIGSPDDFAKPPTNLNGVFTGSSQNAWLYDYLVGCDMYGCQYPIAGTEAYVDQETGKIEYTPIGYMTATALTVEINGVTYTGAWYVVLGTVGCDGVEVTNVLGIRPVITIAKDDLK